MFLVHTTQVNCTFRTYWLASSEVISQVLFTSKQPKKNYYMGFVGMLSQIKLLFGPLVIQLAWYIIMQLFTSVLVKVVDIYLQFGEKMLSMTSLLSFVLYQPNFFHQNM